MKIGRGKLFGLLNAISLVLAAIVAVGWVRSFGDEFHLLSFMRGGQRLTVKLRWGQIVLFGPPDGKTDDAEELKISRQMSNDDFDWQPLSTGHVEGTARTASPTWKEYEKFRGRYHTPGEPEPMARAWLAMLDDPQKFLPAHMMLLHAAEPQRNQLFHRSSAWREAAFKTTPVIVDDDQRREPPAMQVDPVLYFVADAQGGPDFSRREKLRQEWHDVLDERRGDLFVGWVFLAAMILPLAWIARPRWGRKPWRWWIFNWVALVSMIMFMLTAAMWVRSYIFGEEFAFAPGIPQPTKGPLGKITAHSWWGSSDGKLLLLKVQVPESIRVNSNVGYAKSTKGAGIATLFGPGAGMKGEKSWKMPGITFFSFAPQLTRTASLSAGNFWTTAQPGIRSLEISWWLIVSACMLIPLIWARQAGVMWARRRRQRRTEGKICVKCGYDMRATPERCPECGQKSQN